MLKGGIKKDKWRNMSSRWNVRTHGAMVEPPRGSEVRRTPPSYGAMIYEALSSIEDPNGLDVDTMVNYIEPRYELPVAVNFRKSLTSKLRRLMAKGFLEKVGNRYKMKGEPSGAGTSRQVDVMTNNVDNRNVEHVGPKTLADNAAYAVAVAENSEQESNEGFEKAKILAELLEESMVMLQLAEELHEQCLRDGIVLLAP